jgi:exosortase
LNRLRLPKIKSFSLSDSAISIAIRTIAIVSITLALFSNDLTVIFSDALQSQTTSYVLLIPFILVYLIYRKRKMFSAVIPISNKNQTKKIRRLTTIAGILLFVTAILIYWHGSYTFTPLEYHIVALPIFTAALVLILFNPQTLRQAAFPIAFLFFLAPPPSEILYAVGAALSTLSSMASSSLVGLLGIPTSLTNEFESPTIAITRANGAQLNFNVDVACSGIYSLMGFIIIATLIAYIIRDKPWKKAALFLTGIPLIYLLNVLRITIILLLGYQFGENLALQVFHSLGGWVLLFIGTLLLLAVSEKIFKTKISEKNKDTCPDCLNERKNSRKICFTCGRIIKPPSIHIQRKDIIKIFTLAAIVVVLISIQAPAFALTQTPKNVIVSAPTGESMSTEILPNPPNYQLDFLYRDTEFEELSQQDMSIAYAYYPEKANLEPIWVTLEIASQLTSLHRWEICLVQNPLRQGWDLKVVQLELTDIQISQNPLIIGRYFLFDDIETNQTQSVLYWYESAIFETNSTSQQKHVKISVIAYPDDSVGIDKIKDEQLTIAKEIINYWEPIKFWSYVTLPISEAGGYSAALTVFALAAIMVYYMMETRQQKNANRNSYTKLSETNRDIVDAILKTQKNDPPTLNQIFHTLQTDTKGLISKDQLIQKLRDLERERIIEGQIKNINDQPIQIWKV